MMTAYGLCDGRLVPYAAQETRIPLREDVLWIDLHDPTREEEKAARRSSVWECRPGRRWQRSRNQRASTRSTGRWS
jgi:hypothetical protein